MCAHGRASKASRDAGSAGAVPDSFQIDSAALSPRRTPGRDQRCPAVGAGRGCRRSRGRGRAARQDLGHPSIHRQQSAAPPANAEAGQQKASGKGSEDCAALRDWQRAPGAQGCTEAADRRAAAGALRFAARQPASPAQPPRQGDFVVEGEGSGGEGHSALAHQMKSLAARLLARERGLFAGAAVVAAACAALGVPFEFVLFGLTLAGVALFHHHTLQVALIGLGAIVFYKLAFTGFKAGPGMDGLALHMLHEWVILANLFGLLLGFALLSNYFEASQVPAVLPRYLPDDWKGALALLFMIFVLSSFLDNIAAALIGGTIARTVFRGKVHIGYLAAIVAASNAGGSGSVVGDTTTTMMWIAGVSPLAVVEAYVAAVVAMLIFAVPASIQQQRFSPIQKDPSKGLKIDPARVFIVAAILVAALAANIIANLKFPAILDTFPVLGITVWAIILLTAGLRAPD